MKTPTISRLFELLAGPRTVPEPELAQLLGIDLPVLKARLVELRSRGIVSGPFGEGPTTTWKSWFPSVQATTLASERSGLPVASGIPLRRAWWKAAPTA